MNIAGFPHPFALEHWLVSVEAEVSPDVLAQIERDRDLAWRYLRGELIPMAEVEAAVVRMVTVVKARPR